MVSNFFPLRNACKSICDIGVCDNKFLSRTIFSQICEKIKSEKQFSHNIKMKRRAAFDKHPSQLTIREQLGISQEHYAQYCKISLSMLAMIETKKRSWPLDKDDYEIRIAFKESENDEALPVSSELTPSLINELKDRLLDLKVEILKKEKEDGKFQFTLKQAEKRRIICGRLRPKQSDPESIQSKLVNYWDLSAQVKLEQKHQAIAELEEIHIDSVRKQIAVLEKWLK